MLEISMLPARQGDSLWIRWGRPTAPHQMLVDMGTVQTGRAIRRQIEDMPESQRGFELLVVTHVDSDHIGGVISSLVEAGPLPGFTFKDIWFNGYGHLLGEQVVRSPALLPMGPAQGEQFARWLKGQPWNLAFSGWPVRRVPGETPRHIMLADGLTLTVLGPTQERLTNFLDTWVEEVAKALHRGSLEPIVHPGAGSGLTPAGLIELGRQPPRKPTLPDEAALVRLAESHQRSDPSKANGSSIQLLLEYRGIAVLLSGDAFAADILAGIRAISPDAPLALDAFKLPHHGSRQNVHADLIAAVECQHWLVSTDGTQHYHPDAEAVARILLHGSPTQPTLFFNVPCKYNDWWAQPEWRERFRYKAVYGTAEEGLTVSFD